jgi:hypothetical protein
MKNLINKIKKEPKFNTREINKLVKEGWIVEGDRTWASRNGEYCLPKKRWWYEKN